jgi:hypothetical protein
MKDDAKNGMCDVGFCKPPKRAQFKKGQSGNPKGRPKGSLNLATVLERALRQKVVVIENGRRKVITKLEAAITQLANKAAAGDGHAIRHVCQLVISDEERAVDTEPTARLSETDQRVVDNILKRFQQRSEESNDETDRK